MYTIEQVILLAAILILAGIFSSKVSARIGLPVLVLFLIIGMLAGEQGIGGIVFNSPNGAYALGSLALAMILFDGGLQTPFESVKKVWKPASLLATFGVLITAIATGAAATYILDLPLLEGMLIGAIVGSTDAAAVFSQLRNAGVNLNLRLKSLLEIESASNDPMAIFLTVGLLGVLMGGNELGVDLVGGKEGPGIGSLLQLFVMQMGIGAVVGVAVGWLAIKAINKVSLNASGLYPVMVAAFGLLSFGIAANIGGSGFLAVFISGVIIGNSSFAFQRSTFLFHDGLAWLSQIAMFVVLGLLVTPKSVFGVWQEGLLIAMVLILIARPLAVMPFMKPFGFNLRESVLVSWVGLRGSVPIILAIFPLVYGLPGADLIFNVVFFVVLISAIVQGSSLAWVAKKLGLTEQPPAAPAAMLEISSLGHMDAEIVQYMLGDNPRAAGRRISQMALPTNIVVAMITRGKEVIMPRGSTLLQAGDHLFVILKHNLRPFVDSAFSEALHVCRNELPKAPLPLKSSTRVGDVANSYGIYLGENKYQTLEQLLKEHIAEEQLQEGHSIIIEGVKLEIAKMIDTRIATVAITSFEPAEDCEKQLQ